MSEFLVNQVHRIPFGNPAKVATIRYQYDGTIISISAQPKRGAPGELTSLRFIGHLCSLLRDTRVSYEVLERGKVGQKDPDRVIIRPRIGKPIPFSVYPFLPHALLTYL